MKRISVAVAVLFLGLTNLAFADMPGSPMHRDGGLGFHNSVAPIGLRWWFAGQKVGLDLGVGFASEPALGVDPDQSVKFWAFEAGVPFVGHSWERVHVILRPGILYESQEVAFDPPGTDDFDTRTETTFSILGEIEAELFLMDNASVSASHGIRFSSFDPDLTGVDSQSSFFTFGNNFTEIGFHVYFLGGRHSPGSVHGWTASNHGSSSTSFRHRHTRACSGRPRSFFGCEATKGIRRREPWAGSPTVGERNTVRHCGQPLRVLRKKRCR